MHHLHIDIETYSSVDLKKCGLYKYIESPDFEIQLFSYAFNDEPVQCIDVARGEHPPLNVLTALFEPTIIKHAHNAMFERTALSKFCDTELPVDQWECSLVKCAYCGLPLSLDDASEKLETPHRKLGSGKDLIRLFSKPGKTKRNYPKDYPEKWEEYKVYNIEDVETERDIFHALEEFELPAMEQQLYVLDQIINDRGILVDLDMAQNAIDMNEIYASEKIAYMQELTGIVNPKSPAQLKKYMAEEYDMSIQSLNKKEMPALLKQTEGSGANEVLKLRNLLTMSSIKKYTAMVNYANKDCRARGLFQFYGANRTGRWAGRGIQLQNLRQNHLKDLELARSIVCKNDVDMLEMTFGEVSDVLSQLIRTAFIAPEGMTFLVADFSAIEARVLAWLAGEQWRLDVFASHGKIYEASAAMMFNVPIESITKGSDLRQKGKVAELALGYQGALEALRRMGGESMGLSDKEMKAIVKAWRIANPKIVEFWNNLDECALETVMFGRVTKTDVQDIYFRLEGNYLTIELPSGRKLFYLNPRIVNNRFNGPSIAYDTNDKLLTLSGHADTYGGKFAENITQAIARDLLAESMLKVTIKGYKIVIHVHDEIGVEIYKDVADENLRKVLDIMGEPVSWAPGLLLRADGYITDFYKKD